MSDRFAPCSRALVVNGWAAAVGTSLRSYGSAEPGCPQSTEKDRLNGRTWRTEWEIRMNSRSGGVGVVGVIVIVLVILFLVGVIKL